MLMPQAADGLSALAVCHFRHAASVHDADVRHFILGGSFHPSFLQLLLNGACLCKVELATERVENCFLAFYHIHGTKVQLFLENAKFFKKR
jgi:hypothetical protein